MNLEKLKKKLMLFVSDVKEGELKALSATDAAEKFVQEHVTSGLIRTDSCLANLKVAEPVFVLRAQDLLASPLVRVWAEDAKEHGLSEEKYQEAIAIANAMDKWPTRKFPD